MSTLIPDLTKIPAPRTPLIDERTGLMSREWYRFFYNLFNLAGSGGNFTSLTDLQKGPPSVPFEALQVDPSAPTNAPTDSPLVSQVDEIDKQINALESQPESPCEEYNAETQKEIDGLELLPRAELGTMAALQQANVPWLTFDTTASGVPPDVGTVAWDGGTTLGVQMTPNVLLKVGEAEYIYARASSAVTKGQVCYHTGAVGSSGVTTVAPAPINLTDPNQIVGIAAESIALNDFGLIQISGDIKGFDTTGSSVGETWADGDSLYYNPAFVGSMTNIKPVAPNQKTYMGEVINAGSGGSGSMHIRISQGSVLGGTDSNVQFGTVNNGDLIQYDSVLQYWKNVAPSSISIGTATNLAGGLAGSVPYQTAPGTTTFLNIGTALQVLKVNAGATAPEWVSGAALTKVDDTNVTLTLGGTPATSLLAATSLTLGWTGQLGLTRGGTNASLTASAGAVAYSTSTALALNTAGNSGDWLKSNGTSAPAWTAPAALTKVDDTNVTLTLGGSASTALLNAASLTLGWTGQLAVSRGGTGVATATANTVFSGPTAGAAAAPSFRSLVAADIPALSYVSSVGATAPITSTGGLTPTIGVTSAALTKVDDTNVTLTLGGSPTTALLAATSLTLGWTGQLGLARGGTNASLTASAGSVAYSTASALALNTAGNSGDWLKSAGTGAPTWAAPAALTKVDDTNVTLTLGGSASTALLNAASLTLGWTGTLAVSRGGTGTGTAFTAGSVVFAGASGVYSQNNANFFWDNTNTRLGIGTATPGSRLTVGASTDPASLNATALIASNSNSAGNAEVSLGIGQGGTSVGSWVGLAAGVISGGSPYFAIKTRPNAGGASVERLRIDGAGSVGIGTSSPASILHAKSTTGVIATLDGSGTTTGAIDTGAALMFNGYDGVNARNFVQISAYKENSTSGNYATYLAFSTRPNGGSLTERVRITSTGNIYGTSGTTGMTDGFFYIPAAAGVPTGTPTAIAGRVPMYYDTTNNKFYIYNGAWKSVALA